MKQKILEQRIHDLRSKLLLNNKLTPKEEIKLERLEKELARLLYNQDKFDHSETNPLYED